MTINTIPFELSSFSDDNDIYILRNWILQNPKRHITCYLTTNLEACSHSKWSIHYEWEHGEGYTNDYISFGGAVNEFFTKVNS